MATLIAVSFVLAVASGFGAAVANTHSRKKLSISLAVICLILSVIFAGGIRSLNQESVRNFQQAKMVFIDNKSVDALVNTAPFSQEEQKWLANNRWRFDDIEWEILLMVKD